MKMLLLPFLYFVLGGQAPNTWHLLEAFTYCSWLDCKKLLILLIDASHKEINELQVD
jgi:hypothetical protein